MSIVDILVIEDDIELGTILCDFLMRDGYSCYLARYGEEGMEFYANNTVKLILLDLILPGMDGFSVCQMIRAKANVPLIIMSAKTDKVNKIEGLNLGADDYFEKPFDIDILRAKIKAQLRRSYDFYEKGNLLSDGNLTVDIGAAMAFLNGKPLILTIKEYELLVLFLENRNKTLHKDWIFNRIWGIECSSELSTLTVHINTLREKIERNPKRPERIITIWGIGYKYETI